MMGRISERTDSRDPEVARQHDCSPRRVEIAEFAGHPLGDIQAQQYRPELHPAHGGGEAGRPVAPDRHRHHARARQGRGTGSPCPRAHSRARPIAAVRGFSIAGTNSASRPERTPILRSFGRMFGARVSSSTPGMMPSVSPNRWRGHATSGSAAAASVAANSGARSARTCASIVALQPRPQPLPLRPIEEIAVQHCTRGRATVSPRIRRAIGAPSQVSA